MCSVHTHERVEVNVKRLTHCLHMDAVIYRIWLRRRHVNSSLLGAVSYFILLLLDFVVVEAVVRRICGVVGNVC